MTPKERAFFQSAGVVLGKNFPALVLSTLSFGISTGLFIVWSYLNLERGLGTPQRKIMLAILVATYLLNAANTVGCVSVLKEQFEKTLIDRAPGRMINEAAVPYEIVQSWANDLQLIINDCIVVWRAWVLYPDQKWAKVVPCFLLVGTVGLFVPHWALSESLAKELINQTGAAPLSGILSTVAFCLSFVTNLVATFLILHKLRVHRRRSRGFNLNQKQSMTRGQRVLLILVESGLAFCTLQALDVALLFTPSTSAAIIALYVFESCFWSAAPLFPFIVLIVIQTNASIVDTQTSFNLAALQDIIADVEHAPDRPTTESLSLSEDPDTVTSAGLADVCLNPEVSPSSAGNVPAFTGTESAPF